MTNYSKRIISDFKIVFIGTYISALLAYLLRLFLARTLSIEDYGLTFAIISMFGIFGILSDLGLGSALTKFIPEFLSQKKEWMIKSSFVIIVAINFIMAIIVSICFILLSKYISLTLLGDLSAWILIVYYAVYFSFSPIITCIKSSFRGFGRTIEYALSDLSLSVILLIGTIFFTSLNFGVASFFLSYAIYGVLGSFVLYHIFIKKIFPKFGYLKFKYNKKLTKKVFGFGFYIGISNVFGTIFGRLDTFMLTILSTLTETAYFQTAFPLSRALWDLGTVLGIVMLPIISEAWSKKHFETLAKDINLIYLISLVVFIPLSIVLFVYSKDIINLLYGEKYIQAELSLKILSFAVLFKIMTKINNSIIIGIGKPNYLLKYVFIGAIVNIISNIILIPRFGSVGASYSLSISFFLILIYSFIETFREIKLKIEINKIILVAILNILFFVTNVYFSNTLHMSLVPRLAFGLITSGIGYFSLIIILKILKIEDILDILSLKSV